MPLRIIDLSVPLEIDVSADPNGYGPAIAYVTHKETAMDICRFFPGLEPRDLPDGEGWALDDGRWDARDDVDDVPLEWCFRPGVKLDFRHFPDGYVVRPEDIDAELARVNHRLQPLDIVVVNTRAGAAYGTSDYVNSGCGMGRDATMWLTTRGVRVVGTDAWSWDAPFAHTARRFGE